MFWAHRIIMNHQPNTSKPPTKNAQKDIKGLFPMGTFLRLLVGLFPQFFEWKSTGRVSCLYFLSSQTDSNNIYQYKLTLAPLMLNNWLLQSWILQISWVPFMHVASSPCTKCVETSGLHISAAHLLRSQKKITPKSLMSYLRFWCPILGVFQVGFRWYRAIYLQLTVSPCLAWFPRIFSCLTSFLRLGAPLPLPFFCFFPPEASV